MLASAPLNTIETTAVLKLLLQYVYQDKLTLSEFRVPFATDHRCVLGRMAKIGDLYDIRTDCFTGQSVWRDANAPQSCIETARAASTTDEFEFDVQLDKKLRRLRVEDELQLSVAVGLAEPEGMMRSLLYHHMSPGSGIMFRTVTTVNEQVTTPTFEDIQASLAASDIELGNATHVVVGISWGGIAAVCLEQKEPQTELEGDDMNRELQEHLKAFADATDLQTSEQLCSVIDKKYTIRYFANCGESSDEKTGSLNGTIELLQAFPASVHRENGEKGVPLSYALMPLSVPQVPETCDASDSRRIVRLFAEIAIARQELSQLDVVMREYKNHMGENETHTIFGFTSGFSHAEGTLKGELARAVLAFRSKGSDKARLRCIVREFDDGPYARDRVSFFLKNQYILLENITFTEALCKQAVTLFRGEKSEFDTIKHRPNVYVLFASENSRLSSPLVWNENTVAFFETIKDEKKSGSSATFVYVESEEVRSREAITKTIAIYHYQNGRVVCHDVAEDRAILSSLNRAKSSQPMDCRVARPVKRAFVELSCPGPNCGDALRMWSCGQCREQLEYGYDDYFYCACGRGRVNTFCYKCNGDKHGDDFMPFDSYSLDKRVGGLKPTRYLNLLLLGETGVGKSTWINGFVNYLSFESLDEAENHETVFLIPTKFVMTNEKFEKVEVITGSDSNESQKVGQSVTQYPKSYVFHREGTCVRIIDTPGIGDTRGIDKDKENMQHIMTHLANLDEINGILVLLKPNSARLTVMFSFCIKQLLTHLHRDACKNIVFCFTNARSTFYRPGDTLPALEELLTRSRDIDIKLNRDTIYCIDNESVRFLAALKQEIQFDEDQRKQYASSWEISVKETNRLIDNVSSLTPHKVKNTISLNDARRLVVALSRPIAEIGTNIRDNISVVEQKKKEIAESVKRQYRLAADKLKVKVVYFDGSELGYPRTVCTDQSCVEFVSTGAGSVKQTNYKTHCHPHCYLSGTQKNVVNCTALQQCAAMTGENSTCGVCGHSWSVHMHITYEVTKKFREEEDSEVKKLIANESTYMRGIEKIQADLQERVKKLENEENTVTKVSAQFACFLKLNATAPYNDALADYLDVLIKAEQGKVGAGGEKDTLERLRKMKVMYEYEVKVMEQAFKDTNVQPATAGDIKRLYDEKLYKLEVSGPMLKNVMNVSEAEDAKAAGYCESRIQPRRKPTKFTHEGRKESPQWFGSRVYHYARDKWWNAWK